MLQELLCADFGVIHMLEARDHSRRRNDLVVIPTLLVVDTHWIACTADLNHLQDTAIAELLGDRLAVVLVGLVLRVGLDAPDEVGLCGIHDVHEVRELVFEFRGHRVFLLLLVGPLSGSLICEEVSKLHTALDEASHECVGAARHALDEVVAELVLVLVQEGICAVLHWTGKVLDHKPCGLRLDLVESPVPFVCPHQLVAKALVRTLWHHALLIENG
mmetsp:Transcript_125892/g.228471  ORF Transcript_125892/g.228471 Transcript_125892/m.228471 type:complete len:217 (+) Transcript_125892:3007-3657(+)